MTAATEGGDGRDAVRTRVFISYSRKDLAFVDRLEVALRARGVEPSIDRSEIYAFEDWWKRIQALIAKADTVVFVLSPEAVASDVCRREVDFAASLNKRFAPIVARPVADALVPETLSRLNFIFFDSEATFDTAADRLVAALSTDIGWIRKHTEIGELARRWAEAGRPGPKGLLLRSPVLEEAEQWIASRPRDAPPPTAEALALVAESRRAATRRQRSIVGVAVAVALLAGGLALWAEINRREADVQRAEATQQRDIAKTNEERAVENEELAKANEKRAVENEELAKANEKRAVENEQRAREQRDQALVNQSRFLADQALQLIEDGDAVGGMLLAVEALPDKTDPDETRNSRPYVVDAERALYATFFGRREHLLMRTYTVLATLAYDPDGSRLITAEGDTGAKIWDANTGDALVALEGHPGGVIGAVFSSDGGRVLTWGNDGTVRIWDASNGRLVSTLVGHLRAPVAAFFMPDGRHVVSAGDASVRVWDAEIGAVLHNWAGHLGRSAFSLGGSISQVARTVRAASGVDPAIIDAAISRDGARLVTTGWDGTAHVWGLDGEGLITVLRPPPSEYVGMAHAAAFSPDGGRIAVFARVAFDLVTSEDPNGFAVLRVFDAETGQQTLEVKGPWSQLPGRIAFSPDGALLVLAESNRFRVFDSTTGTAIRTFESKDTIEEFQFSKDGTRILSTTTLAGAVEIWDVGTGTMLTRFAGAPSSRTIARFSPDETHVATSGAGTASVWGFEPPAEAAAMLKLDGKLGDIVFSPDGALLATCALTTSPSTEGGEPDFASARATVTMWDVTSKEKVWELRDLIGGCGLAFSNDGARLAMHSYRAVKTLDARSGQTLTSIDAPLEGSGQVTFSPDGAYLLSTSLGTGLNVWDAASGEHVRAIAMFATVQELRFSPDGTLLALSDWNQLVGVFDFATGALRSELPSQNAVVTTLAFTRDGGRLVTSDGENLRLWDAATGALIADFVRNAAADATQTSKPLKFALSPDGRTLLVDYVSEVVLFDLDSMKEVKTYQAFSGSQRGPEFTPDGRRMILTSPPSATALSVVDIETGETVLREPLEDYSLGADALVSPDGRTIATYRLLIEHKVDLWRIYPTPEELLEEVKQQVPRCLVPENRGSYYLPRYEPDWCHMLSKWPFSRPRLGIKMVERDGRVVLDGYFAGSLAESAGFAAGDVIIAIDGEPITNRGRVSELVARAATALAFTVERAGEQREIQVSFPQE